jgi:murein DD-endopeptidase MepM/ murein hydrolase activator NlpD
MFYVKTHTLRHRPVRRTAFLLIPLLLLLLPARIHAQQPSPTPSAEPPLLSLPTPPGEGWTVIQGYNCGTHDGWGRLSFDLANRSGRTRGAPVLAAAAGAIWYWSDATGTLLLKHDHGYFTMYTHMQSHLALPRGTPIARGALVGTVGNVGAAHTEPHLHFTLFQRVGSGADDREPRELNFAGDLRFPDNGACNQYGGEILHSPPSPQPLPWPRLLQTGQSMCRLGGGLSSAARPCAR